MAPVFFFSGGVKLISNLWHPLRVAITLMLLVLIAAPACATGADSIGGIDRVIVVVIDRVDVDDYEGNNLVNIKKLAELGAVALVNNNTGAGIHSEHTYPTIGAGAHVIGSSEAFNGFNIDEEVLDTEAGNEYYRRTGWQAPEDAIVQLAIGRLLRANQNLGYPAKPGALGQGLSEANLSGAVLGNADSLGIHRRLATTITMDRQGITAHGTVDKSILIHEVSALGSLRTNYPELMRRLENYRDNGVSLIVVETGDSTRVYEERDRSTERGYALQRNEVLSRADNFVGELTKKMDFSREVLMVVTPTPTAEAIKGNRNLTLMFVAGPGFEPGSLLISGTTKRDGIVKNTDIAPTILKLLNTDPVVGMSGRPLFSSELKVEGSTIGHLLALNKNLVATYQARPPLQSAYVIIQIIVLFVALFGIFFRRQMAELIKPFLLLVMSVPLAELLMPLLPKGTVLIMALQLIVTTVLIVSIALYINRKWGLDPFIFICITTAGAILTDLMNASFLQKQSILGYDPIVGARFYGIGNEYMGILIGSVIIGTTASIQYWERWRKPLIMLSGIVFIFTVYAMAAPQIGTNVGGTIAATSALVVTFLLLIGVRFRLSTIFAVAGIVVVALIGFIAFDLSRPPDLRSHIGTTASLIINAGPGQILDIIQRKWAMNMKLLRYTVWTRILLASLAVLALLFYRPIGVMESIQKKYPYLFKGFIGVVTGALVAFAFNDSGVVAAATAMIFGAPPLVYLVLSERTNR